MKTDIPKQLPPRLKVENPMYPGFTSLDLAEPQAVLVMHAETCATWKSLDPVSNDCGMAGPRDGYSTATHCANHDVLNEIGIETALDRVVIDGNRITGGGVPAGPDMLAMARNSMGDAPHKTSIEIAKIKRGIRANT